MTTKQIAELLKPLIKNENINFSTLNERFELTESQCEEQILSDNDMYKAVLITASNFTIDEIALIISLNELCEEFEINPREIVCELNLFKENSKQEEATVSSEELPEITNEEIMEIGNKLMKCVYILDEQKIDALTDFEKFVSIVENNLTKRELAISNCHLLRINMLSEIENLLNK
jgi:hypothetical protein